MKFDINPTSLTDKHDTDLGGLDSGLAAVSSVVVTEGSVVDRIAVVVSHERLNQMDQGENSVSPKNLTSECHLLKW